MNPQPQVGDTIDILVKGVRVTHIEPAMPGFGDVVYAAIPKAQGTGNDNSMLIPADSPAITLTVTTPATSTEWPPRLGDLWRDRDGSLWFATTAHRYSHGPGDMPAVAVVELVHTGGGPSRLPDEVNRECGPFTLVRREQPQDVWPPQAGDLWKDKDGDVWKAVDTSDGLRLHLVENSGHELTVQELYDTYSPLTFVSREDVWPPRVGDVWRDNDGDEWTAVDTPDGMQMRQRQCQSAPPTPASEVRKAWGPLTFIRRDQPDADR